MISSGYAIGLYSRVDIGYQKHTIVTGGAEFLAL